MIIHVRGGDRKRNSYQSLCQIPPLVSTRRLEAQLKFHPPVPIPDEFIQRWVHGAFLSKTGKDWNKLCTESSNFLTETETGTTCDNSGYLHEKFGVTRVVLSVETDVDRQRVLLTHVPAIHEVAPRMRVTVIAGQDALSNWFMFQRARIFVMGDSSYSVSASLLRNGLTISLSRSPTTE